VIVTRENGGSPSPEAVTELMTQVIDPELGIDVVSLGMVGEITIEDGHVVVPMRLTSMSCPFWDLFVEQVRAALMTLEGVADVAVTWDRATPWTPELMSESARLQLEAVGLMPPRFRAITGPAQRTELPVLGQPT
jgi:metal-sulfur cluster biosynthetic enzyme